MWVVAELAKCNKEDFDKLALLMMEWDEEMMVPQQWMTNLMCMIPRKRVVARSPP